MMCARCRGRPSAGGAWFYARPDEWPGAADRLSSFVCLCCGGKLPVESPTERLLAMLSRLARFGLFPGDAPRRRVRRAAP